MAIYSDLYVMVQHLTGSERTTARRVIVSSRTNITEVSACDCVP